MSLALVQINPRTHINPIGVNIPSLFCHIGQDFGNTSTGNVSTVCSVWDLYPTWGIPDYIWVAPKRSPEQGDVFGSRFPNPGQAYGGKMETGKETLGEKGTQIQFWFNECLMIASPLMMMMMMMMMLVMMLVVVVVVTRVPLGLGHCIATSHPWTQRT